MTRHLNLKSVMLEFKKNYRKPLLSVPWGPRVNDQGPGGLGVAPWAFTTIPDLGRLLIIPWYTE
jgi:hypothetical protein